MVFLNCTVSNDKLRNLFFLAVFFGFYKIPAFFLYFLLGGSVVTARPSGNPQLEKFRLNIIGSGKPPTGLNREVTSIFFLSKIGLA